MLDHQSMKHKVVMVTGDRKLCFANNVQLGHSVCTSAMRRARVMNRRSWSGRYVHSLRKWLSGRLVLLHKGHDFGLRWGIGRLGLRYGVCLPFVDSDLIPLTSPVVWISSIRDCSACEISGLIDANVLERSSVPYFCFTTFGRSRWIRLSHINTMVFSTVGESSSSVVGLKPQCVMPPSFNNKLSSKNAANLWYRSS